MVCPACDQSLSEHDAQCAACGFSLEVAGHEFGAAPSLQAPVSDPEGALSGSERKKLVALANEMEARFPQVRLAVVVRKTPEETALRTHAFWLFNRSGLCSPIEKGGACHLILLLLDPVSKKLALMVGYGLEPFIGRQALAECLSASKSSLASGRLGEGLISALRGIERLLLAASASAAQTFGLAPERTVLDDTGFALDPATAIYLPAY
jgi:uncharacterized membrane protein YgcG